MPPRRRAEPNPDPYTASNLRTSAWEDLRDAKEETRGPSQSAVLRAALAVARRHRDEWTAALEDAE